MTNKVQAKNLQHLVSLHSRRPTTLPDEPIRLEPALLAGSHPQAPRAALSILTHNQILIGHQGAVAQKTEDVEGLDIEGTVIVGGLNNEVLSSFMTEGVPTFDNSAFLDLEHGLEGIETEGFHDWIADLLNQGP